MVLYVNKNFFKIPPLFIPSKRLIIIAYENTVEVLNWEHNIICKVDLKDTIIKLEKFDDAQLQFLIALNSGSLIKYDIKTKMETNIFQLENGLKNLFYYNGDILAVENDQINFYPSSNMNQKKEIVKKPLAVVAYSKKTGIIAMVEKSLIQVLSVGNTKKLSHTIPKQKKNVTFTTVCCHPSDNVVATGDSAGRIMIWYDVLVSLTKSTVLHWHFLSLKTITFDADGKHIISGGREHVLVKWDTAVTDAKHKKRFFPRLESDIETVQTFDGDVGEFYLVTLSDNSLHIVTNALRSINTYMGLVQRSAALHEKIVVSKPGTKLRVCPLNPIGLISCHKMVGGQNKYRSCIMMNGHEGKLQFYDPYKRVTRYQLDVARQNWPTEAENSLIPGFLQVQRVAVSACGRFIATFHCLGVKRNPYSLQKCLKIFQWNEETDNFEIEANQGMDMFDKVVDILFNPSGEMVQIVTESMIMISMRRSLSNANVPNWTFHNVFQLDELLHSVGIVVDISHAKTRRTRLVTSDYDELENGDGPMFVFNGSFIVMYRWSDLATLKTKPVLAVDVHGLADEMKVDDECRRKLGGNSIVSGVLFRNPNTDAGDCYRLVLGLQHGIMIIEVTIVVRASGNLAADLKIISSAISEPEVKSLVQCPGSDGYVAVIFAQSDTVSVFNVWRDTDEASILTVPELDCAAWVPVAADQYSLVGLTAENHLRSVVVCDREEHFQQKLTEANFSGNDLLFSAEEIEESCEPARKKVKIEDPLSHILLYEAKNPPDYSSIWASMYKIE